MSSCTSVNPSYLSNPTQVHCMFHRNPIPPLTRRDALRKMGAGFGAMGLASVLSQTDLLGSQFAPTGLNSSPLAPKPPHFAPKAKHVIQLFMPGGPSQVDTFDYKPNIAKHAGERPRLCRPKVPKKY